MRSPALTLNSASIALLIATGCAAQSTDPAPPSFTARQFVLPSEFRIEGRSSDAYELRIMLNTDQSWSAVVGFGGEVWTANTTNCSELAAALDAFAQLPPLYPGPYDLRDNPRPRPFGRGTPHAEFWTLRLAAFSPDSMSVDMEIAGSQGPYPKWASETVAAIKSCGVTAP